LSFEKISLIFDNFSNKYLITEFIPIADNKVQLLIKDKKINLMEYNEVQFINALSSSFTIIESVQLSETERKIFLLKNEK
jgi:hypothetical protein